MSPHPQQRPEAAVRVDGRLDRVAQVVDRLLGLARADLRVAGRRATKLATTPTLRIAMIKKHQRWQELVVPRMAERLTGPARDFRAQALVAAALSCLDVAATRWTLSNGTEQLDALLDLTIAAVRE
jgi:hypothetical protein